MAYKLTQGWPQHIESGAFVNPDSNTEYLAWLAAGNTPEPADPPPPVTSVAMRQARLALLGADLLGQVSSAIAAIPDATARAAAEIEWEYATEVRRDSPWVLQLSAALGLDAEQLDALFAHAATL